ncbi:hypothetical protein GXP70_10305 [Paenibacillus lycopersici]|uniref:Uncharacterized protein n=1 Tax=Paenibacillus lycopersici TaxID=2704462 RepID=A0A6C0FXT0_9BACL|nr:hypothetical protein [Paenibacillus lycopersici]QHT60291.1 hypothetical protein GXP70_10305 [Paenibacillus lycopersici]
MEDLLKLLFSNIYIVVIVIGFLLSVLNKARGKQRQGSNGMPTFGGGPNGRQQARPPEERPAQPERRRAAPQAQPQRDAVPAPATAGPMGGSVYTSPMTRDGGRQLRDADPSLLERTLEAEKLASDKLNPGAGTRPASAVSKAGPASQPQGASFRAPQGRELRQAFIMAEVLGPPRSKRPLRQK